MLIPVQLHRRPTDGLVRYRCTEIDIRHGQTRRSCIIAARLIWHEEKRKKKKRERGRGKREKEERIQLARRYDIWRSEADIRWKGWLSKVQISALINFSFSISETISCASTLYAGSFQPQRKSKHVSPYERNAKEQRSYRVCSTWSKCDLTFHYISNSFRRME